MVGSRVGKRLASHDDIREPTLKSHCTREPKGTIAAIGKIHDFLLNLCANGLFVRRVSQHHLQLLTG
jgi:hypothetical protein